MSLSPQAESIVGRVAGNGQRSAIDTSHCPIALMREKRAVLHSAAPPAYMCLCGCQQGFRMKVRKENGNIITHSRCACVCVLRGERSDPSANRNGSSSVRAGGCG